jgi:hypothetical protein
MTNILIKEREDGTWELIGRGHSGNGNDCLYSSHPNLAFALCEYNREFKRIGWTHDIQFYD